MTDPTRMPTVTSLAVVRGAKLSSERVTYGVTLDDGTYFTVRGVQDPMVLMPGQRLDFQLSAVVTVPGQDPITVKLGKLPDPPTFRFGDGDPEALGRAVAGAMIAEAAAGRSPSR